MARPPKDPRQQGTAFHRWSRGFTVRATEAELKKEFGDERASVGTIHKWFANFRKRAEKIGKLDAPFRWTEMHLHELPDSAAGVLSSVASIIGDYGDRQDFSTTFRTPLTFRDAQWLWRTFVATGGHVLFESEDVIFDFRSHAAAGEVSITVKGQLIDQEPLPFINWVYWSQYLSAAERLSVYTGLDMPVSPIEHHVAYRRWSSAYSDERLKSAIDSGLVPKPTTDSVLSFLIGPAAARLVMQRVDHDDHNRKDNDDA